MKLKIALYGPFFFARHDAFWGFEAVLSSGLDSAIEFAGIWGFLCGLMGLQSTERLHTVQLCARQKLASGGRK